MKLIVNKSIPDSKHLAVTESRLIPSIINPRYLNKDKDTEFNEVFVLKHYAPPRIKGIRPVEICLNILFHHNF